MPWFEVCFDCGLPIFDADGASPADAYGVTAGALHVGTKSWHMECAAARRPRADETTANEPQFKRTMLFTMRMSLVERAAFNELRKRLDFPDIAEMLRWFVRAEKLRRGRVDELDRRRAVSSPGVPAPAKSRRGAKRATRAKAARK